MKNGSNTIGLHGTENQVETITITTGSYELKSIELITQSLLPNWVTSLKVNVNTLKVNKVWSQYKLYN